MESCISNAPACYHLSFLASAVDISARIPSAGSAGMLSCRCCTFDISTTNLRALAQTHGLGYRTHHAIEAQSRIVTPSRSKTCWFQPVRNAKAIRTSISRKKETFIAVKGQLLAISWLSDRGPHQARQLHWLLADRTSARRDMCFGVGAHLEDGVDYLTEESRLLFRR